MEKQFVSYNIALELKKIGFDEECLGYYNRDNINNPKLIYNQNQLKEPEDFNVFNQKFCEIYAGGILAPIWQQVFDWFIEKHNIHSSFKPIFGKKNNKKYRVNIYVNEKIVQIFRNEFPDNPYFDSVEDARKKCLETLIRIVNENNPNKTA